MSTFGFLNKKNKTVYSLITMILSYYKCTFHEDKLRRKKERKEIISKEKMGLFVRLLFVGGTYELEQEFRYTYKLYKLVLFT